MPRHCVRSGAAAIPSDLAIALPWEADTRDTRERLSILWTFALLNYLYADVVALFAIVGSPNLAEAPYLAPWAHLDHHLASVDLVEGGRLGGARRALGRLRVQDAKPRAGLGELLAVVVHRRQREGFEHPVLGDIECPGVFGNQVIRGQGRR